MGWKHGKGVFQMQRPAKKMRYPSKQAKDYYYRRHHSPYFKRDRPQPNQTKYRPPYRKNPSKTTAPMPTISPFEQTSAPVPATLFPTSSPSVATNAPISPTLLPTQLTAMPVAPTIAPSNAPTSRCEPSPGNLVVNGDAELGTTEGWDNLSSVAVATEPFCGTYAFVGGSGSFSKLMSQSIDLTAFSTEIDAGGATYVLSAQLQSRTFDFVYLWVSFLGGEDQNLGDTDTLRDPFTNVFEYVFRSTNGTVPSGTRTVLVNLRFDRNSGASTDSFADQVEFEINI